MTAVGIVGVGFLGACLAEGLAAAGAAPVLSPRNAERAQDLARRLGCAVCADNAEVVARSDLVFLATRPGDIAPTARGLPWRADQTAVSVAAGLSLSAFADAVAPARAVRAMPIAACRIRKSPTAFCPADPRAGEVLGRLGTAHPFDDEGEFEAASIFGAFYALVYAFIGEAAGWAEANGLEPRAARQLTARMVEAAAAAVADQDDRAPGALLDDLLTPGGMTEAGLEVLRETGALERWSDALDASLARARAIDAGERRVR